MVGLLQALPGTKLYQRLNRQGRLLGDTTGDNVDGTINFVPQMNRETLRQGDQSLMEHRRRGQARGNAAQRQSHRLRSQHILTISPSRRCLEPKLADMKARTTLLTIDSSAPHRSLQKAP